VTPTRFWSYKEDVQVFEVNRELSVVDVKPIPFRHSNETCPTARMYNNGIAEEWGAVRGLVLSQMHYDSGHEGRILATLFTSWTFKVIGTRTGVVTASAAAVSSILTWKACTGIHSCKNDTIHK